MTLSGSVDIQERTPVKGNSPGLLHSPPDKAPLQGLPINIMDAFTVIDMTCQATGDSQSTLKTYSPVSWGTGPNTTTGGNCVVA
ncbi:hypothetical protein CVT26_014343 [Gymnopilus dilepis]|uniref:Uncharacterized protein n=1 Tax=Gymnopilus dilepis TaxID=231916 RepID=A0A409Y761_9AGAR|nr:hypothetical protein CVT26_014343 [Gymnopilus dilepis]